MRIGIVGGDPVYLWNFRGPLISLMRERGHEVTAFTASRDDAIEARFREKGVSLHPMKLHRVGTNPLVETQTILRLAKLIKQQRLDLVFSYTNKGVIYGSLAARLCGVPRTCSMISGLGTAFVHLEHLYGRALNVVVSNLLRAALSSNEVILLQNEDDREELTRKRVIGKNKKTVLVNGSGVDTSYFEYAAPVKNPVSFLLIARLIRDKGVREYVAAIELLKRERPQAVARLLGPIEESAVAIRSQEIEEWVRKGLIEYIRKQDDVRPYIRDSSVYVLPSYREGTPRSVLEAMSMGRPIITTDVPGCRQTVESGVNGFLVPARHVRPLAEAMKQFVDHPELISDMGKASRERAVRLYNVHDVNRQIIDALGL